MKFIISFFLSLLILLSNGFKQGYAYNHQDNYYSHAKNHKALEDARLGTFPNRRDCIDPSSSFPIATNFLLAIIETEVEEEELSHSRKYLEISSYYVSLFNPQAFGYFLHYLKKRLPFCRHFSYLTSDWSLFTIFQVFRI
jgi:hypothetical protein